MQMISLFFAVLVAIMFILLYVCGKCVRNDKTSIALSNIILLVGSYFFVLYADYRFALVLASITVIVYFCARIHKLQTAGVIVSLVALLYFKYTNFFISSFAPIFGCNYQVLKIILPLGISFYIFSAISYIVDVSKNKLLPKSLAEVALYLAYFPKITSGPIQKSTDFFEQINNKRGVGWSSFAPGIQIFMFGLFKKIVIADRLSVFVDQVYLAPKAFSSFTVFLSTVAYSLQIYFDFSGYSDMAIGVSKILGIDLPRNFNLPYLSHNVTELWKRWHITLSTWLQEYLYISLGGNRKGKVRTYVNLILTMLLGGVWHGANWTYVIWGLLHGIALAIHKGWMSITCSDKKNHNIFENVVSIALTFLFTNLCWIFFRADSIKQAFEIIKRILSFESGVEQPYFWLFIALILLVISSLVATDKSRRAGRTAKKTNVSIVEGYYPLMDLTTVKGLVVFFVLCGLILCLAYTGGSAFIYGKY